MKLDSELGLNVIFLVIGVVIALNVLLTQAPTVADLTSTASGTSLANAGITSTTLAGTVYSFSNVIYALASLFVIVGAVYGVAKKSGRI